MPSAKLTDVVEPWFMGAGAGGPGAAEFEAFRAEVEPTGVRFHASVGAMPAASGKKMAMVCTRTADMPGFVDEIVANGCSHVFLEKPGAPTVGELEKMRDDAAAAGVGIYMGFNKNVTAYVTKGREALAKCPGGDFTLVHHNAYKADELNVCFERNAEGMLKNMAIHEIALACQFWGMRADNIVDVICNPKGGKDSPGCDMRTLGGKTDFASVDITLVNSSGTKVRISADRCSGDGCCATVTDTSNGVVLYQQEMVGGERAKKVAAEAKAHPDWFSYLYTQAEEYAKLKTVCAAHALAKTTPPGVATIEIAIEALKLAEYLTPVLQKKLQA